MRKRSILLLFGLCLLMACGSDEPAAEDVYDTSASSTTVAPSAQAEEPEPAPRISDAQREYTTRMAARKNPMPLAQVREKGKLNPVDEAPTDTSFFLFRADLLEALQQKEVFFLLDHVDENIKNGFGDENGMSNFVTIWNLDSPEKAKNSELWRVLTNILEQGGVFGENRRAFYAPYYTAAWPSDYEPTEHGVIIGSGVRLRDKPSLKSKIEQSVSYDLVKIKKWEDKWDTVDGEKHPWVHVELEDGTDGFVYGKFLGTASGFRVGFAKGKDNKWKMNYLLQGD